MRIIQIITVGLFWVSPCSTADAAIDDLRFFSLAVESANSVNAMTHAMNRAATRDLNPIDNVSAEMTILEALLKAQLLGVDEGLIQKVFVRHNCIPTARRSPNYFKIANLVNRLDFRTDCRISENLQMMYVISEQGAVMLAGPSSEYERIAVIPENKLVRLIDKADSWRIIEYSGNTGYVFFTQLAPYM
jgi:hypothetical protein